MNQTDANGAQSKVRALAIYIVLVELLALTVVILSPIKDLTRDPSTLILMLVLAAIAGRRPINIDQIKTAVSASDLFVFASIAILGTIPAVLVGSASIIASAFSGSMRTNLRKLAFNLAASALAITAASWLYATLAQNGAGGLARTFPLLAATTVYFVASTSFVAMAIALDGKQPFLATWTSAGKWTAVTNYLSTSVALTLLLAYDRLGPAGLVLGVPPMWFFIAYYRSHRDKLREQKTRMDEILNNNRRLEAEVLARTKQLTDKVAELERVREHLRTLADTDELTLLPNRRRFQQYLGRELRRAERFKHPISILLLDVDHFKTINDEYGHPMGDLVLQQLASALQTNVRSSDLAARYGGEEFAIVLTETGGEGAVSLANQLCQRIGKHPFGDPDSPIPHRITVSIGVATYPADGTSADGLIAKADARLYEAKETGRNRVVA